MVQSAVNLSMAFGVQGEIIYDGPVRSAPWTLVSSPEPNVIGATAYTVVSDGIAAAGNTVSGSTVFAGILANPKAYTSFAALNTANMTLPDQSIGELVTMGQMLVYLTTAANIGDKIIYNNTTGTLSSLPPATAVPGGSTLIANCNVILRATAANSLAMIEINSAGS